MPIEVKFPGGVKVAAVVKGHVITTDQPVTDGGGGAAPSPVDLFLASIATCAGFYALRFCQERSIPTDGLALSVETERDPVRKLTSRIRIAVDLPEGFPEKYRPAIARAVDQCTVKRHLVEPPRFETFTRVATLAAV